MRYGFDNREVVIQFPAGTKVLSVLQSVNTGSGAHQDNRQRQLPEEKVVGA